MGHGGDGVKPRASARASGGRPPRAPDGLSADGKQEILIDGVLYDITDFKKRHPGGSVISFYLVRAVRGLGRCLVRRWCAGAGCCCCGLVACGEHPPVAD